MAQLTENEIREAQMLAAHALAGESAPRANAAAAAADAGDAKKLFCENWPTVKKVLQFLADTVGGIVAGAARAIIVAGDFLFGRICKG
jgi:hypothetical protein